MVHKTWAVVCWSANFHIMKAMLVFYWEKTCLFMLSPPVGFNGPNCKNLSTELVLLFVLLLHANRKEYISLFPLMLSVFGFHLSLEVCTFTIFRKGGKLFGSLDIKNPHKYIYILTINCHVKYCFFCWYNQFHTTCFVVI